MAGLGGTAVTGHFPPGLRESACPPLVRCHGNISQRAQEIQKNNNDSPPLTSLPERGGGVEMFIYCPQ